MRPSGSGSKQDGGNEIILCRQKKSYKKRLDQIDYDEFVKKFEQKKTTDDCYTPENVYNVVADYVVSHYGLSRDKFVRPFYPGGDYENYDYPDGCVVVDNPPFSILAHIVDFYTYHRIPFFLFCPGLSSLGHAGEKNGQKVTLLVCYGKITYENGAEVPTEFLTNLESEYITRTDIELRDKIKKADDENRHAKAKKLRKYDLPDNIITAARMRYLADHHIEFGVKHGTGFYANSIDARGNDGNKVEMYGGGYIVIDEVAAERAAAERAAAERAAAERAAAERYELSYREKEILKYIENHR